jgi:hypothetical protein
MSNFHKYNPQNLPQPNFSVKYFLERITDVDPTNHKTSCITLRHLCIFFDVVLREVFLPNRWKEFFSNFGWRHWVVGITQMKFYLRCIV